jgi:hypothetical protein
MLKVLSLVISPNLLNNEKFTEMLPKDVVERAKSISNYFDCDSGLFFKILKILRCIHSQSRNTRC